ncbi:tyrosine-type recombinase/integrase [Candidatus Bathyarchaeota archaeon]|nr:tyrosine-type recombinase/integrase [Candidatus Bathyarchaeota archaeon]
MVREELVNWKEQPLVRWLGSITRESTKATYRSGFRLYVEYTGMNATQLVDEALEDHKRDPRLKTDVVKQRLIGFYNWLMNEAPKRKAGGSGEVIGKGISSKMAHCYVGAVRSFYGTFDVYVKLRGRSALPKPRVVNRRMILSNVDVKRLVDHCRSIRDRAVILTMFQSGMDVSTLCSLKVGDVAEGLARNDHPLKLDLYRPKTGTEYYTFLGRDACEGLKAYLNDLKAKGISHEPNDPLFLKESMKALSREGITENLVQNMLREVAIKSGFVDENLNGRDFNPLSPHALRESFGSIMTNKGVPDTIVDFWLGHEIGEMAEAYKRGKIEDLKRLYLEREQFISITQLSANMKEVKDRLGELELENVRLRKETEIVKTENLELKARLSRVELEITEVKKALEKLLA